MRLIDADSLLTYLHSLACEIDDMKTKTAVENVLHVTVPQIIKDEPTIDAQPVRSGRWIETEPDEDDRKIGIDLRIECSVCHDENSHLDMDESGEITGKTFWKSKFCPNCGAYMRGDQNETN